MLAAHRLPIGLQRHVDAHELVEELGEAGPRLRIVPTLEPVKLFGDPPPSCARRAVVCRRRVLGRGGEIRCGASWGGRLGFKNGVTAGRRGWRGGRWGGNTAPEPPPDRFRVAFSP